MKKLFPALLVGGGLMAAVASCGSRTGLFVPDDEDGFTNVTPDASRDASTPEVDATVPCKPGTFDFELALTQLMFVIDRSGSMALSLEGEDNVPRMTWRWTLLENALAKTVTSFDDEIAMGAKFFPEVVSQSDLRDPERACRVDNGVGIAPARGNAATILSIFEDSTPRGGTPTSEAIRSAAAFLRQQRSAARAIVVATDGAPNCNGDLNAATCTCTSPTSCAASPDRGRYSCLDDDRTIATIEEIAEGDRTPVYVVGIGTTEAPQFLDVLDKMAIAGGRPRPTAPFHYSAQSEAAITDALTTIRDTVARCTYLTPSAPTNPDNITVQIDGATIPRDPTNGWDWVDRQFGEIAFFGDACKKAQQSSGASPKVGGIVRCEN